MLLAVNGFCAARRACRWKTLSKSAIHGALGGISLPLIDALPPDQSQPFIDKGFRPLTTSPPSDAELLLVPGGPYRVFMPGNFPFENAPPPPGVPIQRNHHHPSALAA